MKNSAIQLLKSLETKDASVAQAKISNSNYTQHNLGAGDGKDGFIDLLSIPDVTFKVDIKRVMIDGDHVILHTRYDFFGPKVGFDIFRFDNDRIVEHWDNLQEIADPNPSGHSQMDGTTEITDIENTEINKEMVRNFVDDVLINGKFDLLPRYIDGENYVQHNPNIADGVSGLAKAIEAMGAQGINMDYTTNHMVLGEGNFVLSASEGEFDSKHTAFYDLFRIENKKIVEHWDTIETILPQSQWKNQNGKF